MKRPFMAHTKGVCEHRRLASGPCGQNKLIYQKAGRLGPVGLGESPWCPGLWQCHQPLLSWVRARSHTTWLILVNGVWASVPPRQIELSWGPRCPHLFATLTFCHPGLFTACLACHEFRPPHLRSCPISAFPRQDSCWETALLPASQKDGFGGRWELPFSFAFPSYWSKF